jgi:hypothetical protein
MRRGIWWQLPSPTRTTRDTQDRTDRAMRGEGSHTPRTLRRAAMASRGKRLSNGFYRAGAL